MAKVSCNFRSKVVDKGESGRYYRLRSDNSVYICVKDNKDNLRLHSLENGALWSEVSCFGLSGSQVFDLLPKGTNINIEV